MEHRNHVCNGWGLTPKSWLWILGINFIGQITAQVIVKVAMAGDDGKKVG